jgi:malate dehydrogenase (oxaloacetate-decarboxylating)(NADP+)
LKACELDALSYGPQYIIPKPVDSRLLSRLAPAVAKAAVDSGVASLPLPDDYAPTL